MGHFNKALSLWDTMNRRQILSEMENKAEALGVGRNFRRHPVQPFPVALMQCLL